jgi:hypothetical protein
VRDDDVVEKTGDGLARVSRVGHVRIAALAPLSRSTFLTGHRVGVCAGFVCVSCARASLCLEASEKSVLNEKKSLTKSPYPRAASFSDLKGFHPFRLFSCLRAPPGTQTLV